MFLAIWFEFNKILLIYETINTLIINIYMFLLLEYI